MMKFLTPLGLALLLAACGKVGTLDQPGPLIGEKRKADWDAAHPKTPPKEEKEKPEPLPPLPPPEQQPPKP